jgi:integrase
MSDINKIITNLIVINNRIIVKDLSLNEIENLSNLVLFDTINFKCETTLFGGTKFQPSPKDKGTIIDTGSPHFDFELKAIMTAALHLGLIEGGAPLKWTTVKPRIKTLHRLSSFLIQRNYKSFRDINNLNDFAMRSLIVDFQNKPIKKYGMNLREITSAAKTSRNALLFLSQFHLVTRDSFVQLIDELTLPFINKHEQEHRLKHSIIPTSILKSLISDSVSYIKNAEKHVNKFVKLHTVANAKIKSTETKLFNHIVRVANYKEKEKLKKCFEPIKDINLHAYTLILAFTGMRDSEVFALQNNSHSKRVESRETVFTLISQLSKTTDGKIKLDWVSNKAVYDAVEILSKINKVYIDRAKELLTHHRSAMSDQKIRKYQSGIADNRLFGIAHTAASTRFISASKSCDVTGTFSLKKHRYIVTEEDIEQLEDMNCNYKSVIAKHNGNRKVKYKSGDYFNFTAHQFRHTFAWFIIANRLGDLDDIKYQFKHLNSAMTNIYAERGFESLSQLRTVIEYFEKFGNQKAIENIIKATESGKIAGGGGERLSKLLKKLNSEQSQIIFTESQHPHFSNTQELVQFATQNSNSLRGLPHGYCTKGIDCKIKNAADPSHCLYCDTYFATPKHLPYWEAIKKNCEQKITAIKSLSNQSRYNAFLFSLEDNLTAANIVIAKLTTSKDNVDMTNVEARNV